MTWQRKACRQAGTSHYLSVNSSFVGSFPYPKPLFQLNFKQTSQRITLNYIIFSLYFLIIFWAFNVLIGKHYRCDFKDPFDFVDGILRKKRNFKGLPNLVGIDTVLTFWRQFVEQLFTYFWYLVFIEGSGRLWSVKSDKLWTNCLWKGIAQIPISSDFSSSLLFPHCLYLYKDPFSLRSYLAMESCPSLYILMLCPISHVTSLSRHILSQVRMTVNCQL